MWMRSLVSGEQELVAPMQISAREVAHVEPRGEVGVQMGVEVRIKDEADLRVADAGSLVTASGR